VLFNPSHLRAVSRSVLLGAVLVLRSSGALASGKHHALTPYEQGQVEQVKKDLGLSLLPEANPEGKLVEHVDVVVLEVFDDSDPVPNFFNVFHTRTRQHIVRQELLFEEGVPFAPARGAESARNLRKLRQHSLVVIEAFPGSTPDRVRVLVVVKDVWSLRVNFDIAASDRDLSYLLIAPTEENLFGTHITFGAAYTLTAGYYSIGALATKRRILGTDLESSLSAHMIFNRMSGAREGVAGLFSYGVPFRETEQAWSWGTGIYVSSLIKGRYEGLTLTRYDAPSTVEVEALPIAYRSERILGGYEVVRSFGRRRKLDVGVGVDVDRRFNQWTPPPGTSAAAQEDFRDAWVPVTDTRIGPFAQLFTRDERYLRTSDLETLGLEETYRLGFDALLRVYPASSRLGSTRDLIGSLSGVGFSQGLGDGLLRAVVENRLELEKSGRDDADVTARLRVALPKTSIVRLVVDGVFRYRYENYLNRNLELGGDTRLRGYPPAGFNGSFLGAAAAAVNTELRSTSIGLFGTECGLALFHDAGHAAETLSELSFKQSAGVGLRVLLPQFARTVVRLDWAFPFNPVAGYKTFPGAAFLTFDQAFTMPELAAPTVMAPKP